MTKQTKIILAIVSAVAVIALALAGWLFFQNNQLKDKNQALENTKQSTKNEETNNKQPDATDNTTNQTENETPAPTPTPFVLSESLKENIEAAIETMNTQPLEGQMASSVEVIIAATGGQPPMSPRNATQALDYLSSASSAWDFNLGPAYQNSDYEQYFSNNTFFGVATSGQVVSFHFNDAGKIDRIFMAIDKDLL